MSDETTVGASAAAAHQRIAKATKASGAIIRVKPADFLTILNKNEKPLVVNTTSSFFSSKSYRYLTAYKGLIFYTKDNDPLHLPSKAEVIEADKIWNKELLVVF